MASSATTVNNSPTLPEAELVALLGGTHGDPFSVLGVHVQAGKQVVRCFFPHATGVVLQSGIGAAQRLQLTDSAGFFESVVTGVSEDYWFEVEYDAVTIPRQDPYKFNCWLGEQDHFLFAEGTHKELYRKLGSHCVVHEGVEGVVFVAWAPNASVCALVGEFNDWDSRTHVMRKHPHSGLWELFIPGLKSNCQYKYSLRDANGKHLPYKTDPYAQSFEAPPQSASIVFDTQYQWRDDHWLQQSRNKLQLNAAISIYEVHLPSWRHDDNGQPYTYRELTKHLIPYAVDNGFTHLELLPVSEHPFGGSWGYQPIGLFAPMERLGKPDDFRYFVDECHQQGLGVIMDWVPAHFPGDAHGLSRFDGTALYEHEDPRQGFHTEWNTCIFNFGRKEVRNYLLSNALFWVNEFHLDGLRVDAVASMLYLDYSRTDGEWVPNRYGGRENLEAVEFLQQMNTWVHEAGAITFAEESTSWDGVSRPVEHGGLGFTYKWNMGWMNDVLAYFSEDPINRKYHHDKLTFGQMYAFTENFVLPFSHDEVVYGKHALLSKMPGDDWQKRANLKLLFAYLFSQPGKKLLFMGGEIAQTVEWNHDSQLSWQLLANNENQSVLKLIRDINGLYRREPALHAGDCDSRGFQWIDCDDADNSLLAYYRQVPNSSESIICVFNFTPVVREGFTLGVYEPGSYSELLNTDNPIYGGSGLASAEQHRTSDQPAHNKPYSVQITLPPLAGVYLKLDSAGP